MIHKPKEGDLVHYQPEHYRLNDEFENGVVKEVRDDVDDAVWVVYNCGGEWSRFREFTAAKTNLRDLCVGWRQK